jgi:2-oxo-4-hydroxy-4-carboxy-5-ureidoimidazoline decarboxylase
VSLQTFNDASETEATRSLSQCCTSQRWISRLVSVRPFDSVSVLSLAANSVWSELEEADYLEAFEGHPKIGDVNSLKQKYVDTKQLAAGEQAAVDTASDDEIAALARGNTDYENKFGFIFIVCASGKSAAEMLGLLQGRLTNSREQELQNAAEEQRKIFQLRLEKML